MSEKRPPVRIRFKYNIDTGEIEDFIIDDDAITASEDYHKDIAKDISSLLGRNPKITDAGSIRLSGVVQTQASTPEVTTDKKDERKKIED